MIETKDSGKRAEYFTGARRDSDEGKPRYDNIPLDVLDAMQQAYGGAPAEVDNSQPYFTGFVPISESRYDLIPAIALNRLGGLYHRGARLYGDSNWKRGIPLLRLFGSILRHSFAWAMGDTSEDHATAAAWGWIAIIWSECAIAEGELPESLADAGPLAK